MLIGVFIGYNASNASKCQADQARATDALHMSIEELNEQLSQLVFNVASPNFIFDHRPYGAPPPFGALPSSQPVGPVGE